MTNPVPDATGADFDLLLPTGQVMVHSSISPSTWYLLTPDSTGSYINGTWTTTGSMNIGRTAFDAVVLPSGQVFVVYGGIPSQNDVGTNTAEMYNIASNSWTLLAPDPALESTQDVITPSELLPNGEILVGDPLSSGTELYNPTTNMWSTGGARIHDSEGVGSSNWLKLPNGDILEYASIDSFVDGKYEAELYNPTTNSWSDASKTQRHPDPAPLDTRGGI